MKVAAICPQLKGSHLGGQWCWPLGWCARTQQFPTRPRGFCVAAFEETFFIKRFISERRTRWLLLFLLCFYFPIGERKEEGEHLKRRTGTWENSAYHSVKRACVDGKLRERKRWERGEPFPPPIFRASFDPPSLKSITFPMKRKPIQRRKKKKKQQQQQQNYRSN